MNEIEKPRQHRKVERKKYWKDPLLATSRFHRCIDLMILIRFPIFPVEGGEGMKNKSLFILVNSDVEAMNFFVTSAAASASAAIHSKANCFLVNVVKKVAALISRVAY